MPRVYHPAPRTPDIGHRREWPLVGALVASAERQTVVMSPTDVPIDSIELRHQVAERFPIPSVAYSADGQQVSLSGPLTLGLRIGGFGIVERRVEQGVDRLVVHVRNLGIEERPGPELTFDGASAAGGVGIAGAQVSVRVRAVVGDGVLLGRVDGETFSSATNAEPFGEERLRPATAAEVATVFETLDESARTIELGRHRDHPDIPARVRSKGFSRHTFMCGQSGSGKTYTTGVLFERLLMGSTLDVVVLDPNSDHVMLGSLADPDDTRPEADQFRSVQQSVSTFRARGHDGTHTLCIDFSDLDLDVQAKLLRLDPITDLDSFNALAHITAALADTYSVVDVAQAAAQDDQTSALARRIENLRLADWGLWRRDAETSAAATRPAGGHLGDDQRRFMVVDTGSLATGSERTAVSLAILGNRWQLRRDRHPVLIAIDEAHNVLPASTDDLLLESAVELGVLIAGEGRKFGLHLFIASQRPGKVHPNVLSQCDNLLLMRMNGAADVADLEAVFSHVPPMLLRESLTFGLGQALVAGPLAPLPVVAQVGTRLTAEGGADVPTTWTAPPAS